jgi:aryl-alcohol dehydrogenase-like predicted oxidoreductase
VLSRGLIGGHFAADRELTPGDFRARAPRFAEANRSHNLAVVDVLRALAESKGVSVAQLAIAWVLAKGDDIVALAGSSTPARLVEALASLDVELSREDIAELERAIPPGAVLGDRYPAAGMASLDGERG